MMTTSKTFRRLGFGLSALLVIGCTGDDASTSATSDTDGDTEGETDTTTTTATTTVGTMSGTATTTTMGTGSESNSMSGTETTTVGTTEMTTTMGTTMSTTDMTTTMGGVCGDGVLDAGEECDDGEANGSMRSTCSSECTIVNDSVCGNGDVEMGEECDDGNTEDGDGCAANCTIEQMMDVCGDGMVGGDEACDDGNDMSGDGCEPDCTISPPGECGNGVKEWDELCDDGNQTNNDGCDDDCTPTPLPSCQPPENYISCDGMLNKADMLAPYQAIGLACSDKVNEAIQITGTQFNSPDQNAWQIIKGYGTYMEMGKLLYSPREGEAFVIMSSGVVSQPNGQGILTEQNGGQGGNGANQNPDDNAFLPMYTPAQDQSGALGPQWQLGGNNPGDKIWWSFKTKTPTGTKAYAIDFAFFSSEWPSWVNTTYNDLFVAWQVSEDFVGSISVIDGLSTTITALHPHWSDKPIQGAKTCANYGSAGPGFSCNEPQLAGTGYEGHAATSWVRINQAIDQDKDLELYFFLADMGDTALASAVIIDRFRFSCDECIPADDPQCTGEVPDPNCCGVVLPT